MSLSTLPRGLKKWMLGGPESAHFWLTPHRVFSDPNGFWERYRAEFLAWHAPHGFPVPKRRLGYQRERAFLQRGREQVRSEGRRVSAH